MFKTIAPAVWAFDLEWVPDPDTGRRVYGLSTDLDDRQVIGEMWRMGGATEEDPQPYLKTILCRIVSVAAVTRERDSNGGIQLQLRYLPKVPDHPQPEHDIIDSFLKSIGQVRPQLVGFNSADADLPILIQRGIALGVNAPEFCRRPEKPWEGEDYFHQFSESHIDLRKITGGWGKATPSLHELASASGIPGKMDTSGANVIDLWIAGDIRKIVEYNQFDALTTYLVWLRTAFFGGHFSPPQYKEEEARVERLISDHISGGDAHLQNYLERWRELRGNINK